MKLNSYIDKVGPKTFARRMGVDPSTVSLWKHSKRIPKPKTIIKINKITKNVVTFKEIIFHFAKLR